MGTSWVTMRNGHLVWSFNLRALNCHSSLNLVSNHIRSRIEINYPLNACNCLLGGLKSSVYHNIYVISQILLTCFFLLTLVAKLSNHWFLRKLVSLTVAREREYIIILKIDLI